MDNLTEQDIKRLVREEMKECFESIQSDVRDIKVALLGDEEYAHKGLVQQVKENTVYIERNRTLEVAPKGMKVIEWFDIEGANDKSVCLDEVIKFYGNMKWLVGFLGLTGLINTSFIVREVIQFFMSK